MDAPPCIGCGWCCLRDQCELSHRLHGFLSRCPELFWDEAQQRYLCRLALPHQPTEIREQAQRELFLGHGCCAWHNEWRKDVRRRD